MSSCVNGVLSPDGRLIVAFGSTLAVAGSKRVMKVSTWL
jgi:hypothetical protein